jgi:hypothetical protein
MNTDNNTLFDPTPRLKSSPVPALFIPFKDNENKCNFCGNEYSETQQYEQKYCKNCLFWYFKQIEGNNTNTYLDVHIVTNNSQHEENRNNFSTMNIQEWNEYFSKISYFRQVIPPFYIYYLLKYCIHNKKRSNCESCEYMLQSFNYDSECYQIFSGWIESTLTKKPIPILNLPWWDNYNKCIVCEQELKYIHQESKSYCQKWCSNCNIIYTGCRYCLTTNIIIGITDQSQCKKCKRISFISIDITNLSSGNCVIDEFLASTIFDNNQHYLVANYMNNDNNLNPYKVCQFIETNLFPTVNKMKWIPYPQIKNLSKIGEGGFSTVYKANWSRGTYDIEVAIKKLHGSQNVNKDFLNEVIFNINNMLYSQYI